MPRRVNLQLAWSFVASYGDFGIEVLTLFGDDSTSSITNEFLFDDSVTNDLQKPQQQGHREAWNGGLGLGLWYADGESEQLILTQRGRVFRDLVFSVDNLRQRYNVLNDFWMAHAWGSNLKKPSTISDDTVFGRGIVSDLQTMHYSFVTTKACPGEVFVLIGVEPDGEIALKNVETGDELTFSCSQLQGFEFDQDTGYLSLQFD